MTHDHTNEQTTKRTTAPMTPHAHHVHAEELYRILLLTSGALRGGEDEGEDEVVEADAEAQAARERARKERELARALRDSFPASDPIGFY